MCGTDYIDSSLFVGISPHKLLDSVLHTHQADLRVGGCSFYMYLNMFLDPFKIFG